MIQTNRIKGRVGIAEVRQADVHIAAQAAAYLALQAMAPLPPSLALHQFEPGPDLINIKSPEDAVRLLRVRLRIAELEQRVESLEQRADTVTIELFAIPDETLEVIKPLPVIIRRGDDEFIASFLQANVSASGETQAIALANLADMICSKFRLFSRKKDVLGPVPQREFSVLNQVIRKR